MGAQTWKLVDLKSKHEKNLPFLWTRTELETETHVHGRSWSRGTAWRVQVKEQILVGKSKENQKFLKRYEAMHDKLSITNHSGFKRKLNAATKGAGPPKKRVFHICYSNIMYFRNSSHTHEIWILTFFMANPNITISQKATHSQI